MSTSETPEYRRSTSETPVVVVLRDPDASNEFVTFGEVEVYDIDAGYMDLGNPDELLEWLETHETAAAKFAADGRPDVALCIRETIRNYER